MAIWRSYEHFMYIQFRSCVHLDFFCYLKEFNSLRGYFFWNNCFCALILGNFGVYWQICKNIFAKFFLFSYLWKYIQCFCWVCYLAWFWSYKRTTQLFHSVNCGSYWSISASIILQQVFSICTPGILRVRNKYLATIKIKSMQNF